MAEVTTAMMGKGCRRESLQRAWEGCATGLSDDGNLSGENPCYPSCTNTCWHRHSCEAKVQTFPATVLLDTSSLGMLSPNLSMRYHVPCLTSINMKSIAIVRSVG